MVGRLSAGLVAAVLALPASAQAAFPGTNGRLAFPALDPAGASGPFGTDWSIFTIEPDGSDRLQLTGDGPLDKEPAWSADGTRLLYELSNRGEVRMMNFDGSGNHLVADGTDPAWSPYGAKIVVTDFGGPNAEALWVMNPDGSGATRLTPPGLVYAQNARWSPDGTKIAFAGSPSFGAVLDIYTIEPDGTNLVNLTNDPVAYNATPDWSPDGSKLVFRRGSQIVVMNSDGSGLTPTGASGGSPVWSPDGSRIAYTAFSDGNRIHLMDPDGTNDTFLAHVSQAALDWQPCQGSCPVTTPADYDVPAAARSLRVRLVPLFRKTINDFQCRARGGENSVHEPPLGFSSCSPPAYLPGTVARLGPGAEAGLIYENGLGDIDERTLRVIGGASDVQDPAGADYQGQVTLVTALRLTDTFNGPNLSEPATVLDLDFSVSMSCAPERDPDIGAFCGVSADAGSVLPDSIRAHRRSVIQMLAVRLEDAGANDVAGDADDRGFAVQGLSVP